MPNPAAKFTYKDKTREIEMADINQFKRSKDRIVELIHHLVNKKATDPETDKHIRSLELALYTLELKIAEYQDQIDSPHGSGIFDLTI